MFPSSDPRCLGKVDLQVLKRALSLVLFPFFLMGICLRIVLAHGALEIPGPVSHGLIQVVQNPSSQLSLSLQSNIQGRIVTSLEQVPKAYKGPFSRLFHCSISQIVSSSHLGVLFLMPRAVHNCHL